ncbi:MAG: hypothetical protein JWL84_1098, partial [Rhodospirillales bacterium]|nr:hypothetical protein [Rhodospirillales bacterium]
MSIQTRGGSHTVKVWHKGSIVKGLTRSFGKLAEAKKYDEQQKARQKLGLLELDPHGGVTQAYVTPRGIYVKPLLVTHAEAD